jgi:hypothetical protein
MPLRAAHPSQQIVRRRTGIFLHSVCSSCFTLPLTNRGVLGLCQAASIVSPAAFHSGNRFRTGAPYHRARARPPRLRTTGRSRVRGNRRRSHDRAGGHCDGDRTGCQALVLGQVDPPRPDLGRSEKFWRLAKMTSEPVDLLGICDLSSRGGDSGCQTVGAPWWATCSS